MAKNKGFGPYTLDSAAPSICHMLKSPHKAEGLKRDAHTQPRRIIEQRNLSTVQLDHAFNKAQPQAVARRVAAVKCFPREREREIYVILDNKCIRLNALAHRHGGYCYPSLIPTNLTYF